MSSTMQICSRRSNCLSLYGLCCAVDLKDLEPEDFATLGMKKLEAARLRKALEQL
eukprot:COSAG05_NODE_723_length_7727_cov_19.327871_2_plen_55_part_00